MFKMKIKFAILIFAVCQFPCTIQHDEDEENELESDFGDVMQSFFESDKGKPISDMLFNLGASKNANQILEGLGAAFDSESGTGGIDSSILITAFQTLTSNSDGKQIISWLIELFGKEGGLENLMNFLPTVFSAINSFIETEGQKGESSGNDWVMSSLIEKANEFIMSFKYTQLGALALPFLENSQFFKMFSKDGSFNFLMLGELLENHSFRKYWIETLSLQVTPIIQRMFDPSFRNTLITVFEQQINPMLLANNFPEKSLFNSKNPVDSISGLINYAVENYFGYKIRSKQYVEPVYKYIKDAYNNIVYKGYFAGKKVKDEDLSKKVIDIVNLELIEPVVRAYRAFRFAKKNKNCDKYVMCLINQDLSDETVNLPMVKWILYKASSLMASWSLSAYTKTSFWVLYSQVMDNKNCKDAYHKSCESFHAEEVNVKKEYVHSEL